MPTSQQAWQMKDAQKMFRQVVKSELDILLSEGWSREEAVKALLHRIVKTSQTPSDTEVDHVMTQFKMNREDATRALIVKQELGRLKRRGLDPLAAIEELTCKMQRMCPLSSSNVAKEELKNEIRMELNHEIKEELKLQDNEGLLMDDEYEQEDDEEDDDEEDVPHAPTESHGSAATVFDAVPVSTPKSLLQKATLFTPSLFTKRLPSTSISTSDGTSTSAAPATSAMSILSPTLRTPELYHSKRKRRHLDLEAKNAAQNLTVESNQCHPIHRSSKKHRSEDHVPTKHQRKQVTVVNAGLTSSNAKRPRSSAVDSTTSPLATDATDAAIKRRRI